MINNNGYMERRESWVSSIGGRGRTDDEIPLALSHYCHYGYLVLDLSSANMRLGHSDIGSERKFCAVLAETVHKRTITSICLQTDFSQMPWKRSARKTMHFVQSQLLSTLDGHQKSST